MDTLDLLSYGFMQRSLIAGCLIALACSPLGVLLVLRRLSLIGDGLAHVTFGSAALALFLNQHPLIVSIPVVIAGSLGIMRLTERAHLYGDAAIGIVSAVGIACGVLIASSAGGFNVDLFSLLFGSILAISTTDVVLSAVLTSIVIGTVLVYYRELFSSTFDDQFARVSGIRTTRINALLVMLTAATVVLAMRVVGIMLTSALIVLPAVTALQIARSFKSSIVISCLCSLISVVAGIFGALYLNLPPGAVIIMVNFLLFLASLAYRVRRSRR
jgi:zinc transport system permease protein